MPSTCPVTVVIPTYQRPDQLLVALDKIVRCRPRPSEIVIHIDAGDRTTQSAVAQAALDSIESLSVKVIQSEVSAGPGGGRTRAIAHATHEFIASFDDDSYPLDSDYFSRLMHLFKAFPRAAIIGAAIFHIGEEILLDTQKTQQVPDFIGCGCAYRKSIFQQTCGYLPLTVAYGMEENDLALQVADLDDWIIVKSDWLRVFHDTELTHHSSAKVTAASIANLALLAYLRYPASFFLLGVAQCLNRVKWLIQHRRFKGIFRGVVSIPALIFKHRQRRSPVTSQALVAYRALHRESLPS